MSASGSSDHIVTAVYFAAPVDIRMGPEAKGKLPPYDKAPAADPSSTPVTTVLYDVVARKRTNRRRKPGEPEQEGAK